MTEREAQELVQRLKRLRRVWGACALKIHPPQAPTHFWLTIDEDVLLRISMKPDIITYRLDLRRGKNLASLSYSLGNGVVREDVCRSIQHKDEAGKQAFQEMADERLPFFRRGCWLSGCPIEASAHEKAEWMQGFSREEVEAWKLKI